jgi:hypothetical protein
MAPSKRLTRADRLRRERFLRSISRDGPVATARRLQQIQREQLLRMRNRSQMENPRPIERRIDPGHRAR